MTASPAPDAVAFTVANVLALPELRAGQPEVIAGGDHLARPVRWAHVVAGSSAVPLLDGGELVLTTGAGWPENQTELTRLTEALAEADPAAVILEIGTHLRTSPAALVQSCEAHGIPLVVLHHEVRFVQITQRVHQRILATQNEALEARAAVHTMLTELGLNRSPVDYVIERLSETLRAPVVLEDSAHRVVAWAPGPGADPGATESARTTDAGRTATVSTAAVSTATTNDAEAILAPWANLGGRDLELPEGWERVAVEARGNRWGSLTALPGKPHPAGRRTVLELGAFALALDRLADLDGDQWLELSSKRLFDVLLGGRYRHDTELATQLAASGLPVEGRVLVGATLTGIGDFGSHDSLEHAILETALRRAVAPEGRAILTPDATGTLLALLSFPPGDPRIDSGGATPPLAARLAPELRMLLPDTTPANWRAHLSLGVPGPRIGGLITSLARVRVAGWLPAVAAVGRVTVQQAERQPLAYLMRGLSATPAGQEFAENALAPLLEHDRHGGPGHSGDLQQVLQAYLAHPTNRSLAAQRARLSRSVFYQRLALIEELLGVDLADGETIATLTVALLAHGGTS